MVDQSPTLEEKLAALEAKLAELEKKLSNPETSETKEASKDAATETEKEAKDKQPKSLARVVISKTNNDGVREDREPDEPLKEAASTEVKEYAATLRKIISDDPSEFNNSGEIQIDSLPLWELLGKLINPYPYHIFQGSPQILYSPYEPIIINWEKLLAATEDTNINEDVRKSLTDLLNAIKAGSGDQNLDEYLKKRTRWKEQDLIDFDCLWTLFPPGTLVYGKVFQGHDEVFIVNDIIHSWPNNDKKWELRCWAYDWDGSQFKRLPLRLAFDSFEGDKPINSLPYYPLKYHSDRETLKSDLIRRGKYFRELCTVEQGSQMFKYQGQVSFLKTISEVNRDDLGDSDSFSRDPYGGQKAYSSVYGTRSVVDGNVMVDALSYFQDGRSVPVLGDRKAESDYIDYQWPCQCPLCQSNVPLNEMYRTRYDNANSNGEGWVDEQYLLCPPRVFGYVLHEKRWAQLEVDTIKFITEDDDNKSWSSRLKLENESTKDMILDLVTGHGKAGQGDGLEVTDIVDRKGKGLVILLYGPPGVGKTSTAETVAVKARKPLFSISVADVGTTAKHVEDNLARIFALATTWQAILLIDEADVFLQSRSLGAGFGGNTERNALVSVFLRVLEYYQGILVLTTNQIAQFDVAVHSRIHVAIKYKELDSDRAMTIFMNFLGPLNQKNKVQDMDRIERFLRREISRIRFDGRQIRNVVTSALSLARAQGCRKLEERHLADVIDNVHDFKLEFIKQYEKYKTQQKGVFDSM